MSVAGLDQRAPTAPMREEDEGRGGKLAPEERWEVSGHGMRHKEAPCARKKMNSAHGHYGYSKQWLGLGFGREKQQKRSHDTMIEGKCHQKSQMCCLGKGYKYIVATNILKQPN